MNISQTLKNKRIELQLSQEEVAQKVDISRRTLAYYESGERIPNAETLLKLCALYGLDVNDLIAKDIGGESEGKEQPSYQVIEKIDQYLQVEKEKKHAFQRGAFFCALAVTIVITLILVVCISLKFILMARYGYAFSEATAKMWTSFFESMIAFVNDPAVINFPVVSVVLFALLVLGWAIYFIVRAIRHKKK